MKHFFIGNLSMEQVKNQKRANAISTMKKQIIKSFYLSEKIKQMLRVHYYILI